jgi:hypothetical protein
VSANSRLSPERVVNPFVWSWRPIVRGDLVIRVRLLALSAAVTLAVSMHGFAQQAAPVVDTSKLGPQVGATVPPFSGVDQFGKAQSLATLSGPKGLMLVFSRSADW